MFRIQYNYETVLDNIVVELGVSAGPKARNDVGKALSTLEVCSKYDV